MKTAYFAHSVRGEHGDLATPLDIAVNVDDGIRKCNFLRKILPDWRIYCPMEHEQIYQAAQHCGKDDITSDVILKQCTEILSLADVLFVGSDPKTSEGVTIERDYAFEALELDIISLWTRREEQWPHLLRCAGVYDG